ncbi:MAG: hypothetical protein QM541_10600 [Flavobacterium sp.]|nr:hypothetical protein [Flavobacterium sp.]
MKNLSSNTVSQSFIEIKNHYIATSVFERGVMENEFRQHSAGKIAKKAFDITRASLILGVGIVVLFGDKMNIAIMVGLDPVLKYIFGGICLLYGGFRLYRGIKGDRYL